MHANQVTSSEGLLFYVQPALDATPSTFLSNLQRALDATRSTFLSKHLFPVVFHDACIMESKHKNIQNFVSSFTDTVGDWHLRNFWKKSAKQWRHANASETRGKSASATPSEETKCNKKVAFQFYERLVFSDNNLKSDVSLSRKRHFRVDLMLTKPHGCARDIAATSRLCGSGMGILKPFKLCLQEVIVMPKKIENQWKVIINNNNNP